MKTSLHKKNKTQFFSGKNLNKKMSKVFLCSSIKGLKEALQIVLMPQGNRNFPIFEVTPLELQNLQKSPDDRESNILIADNNVIGPLLYENPPRYTVYESTFLNFKSVFFPN